MRGFGLGRSGEILSLFYKNFFFEGGFIRTVVFSRRVQSLFYFRLEGSLAVVFSFYVVFYVFVFGCLSVAVVLISIQFCYLVLFQLIFYMVDFFIFWNQFLFNLCSKEKVLSFILGDFGRFIQFRFFYGRNGRKNIYLSGCEG